MEEAQEIVAHDPDLDLEVSEVLLPTHQHAGLTQHPDLVQLLLTTDTEFLNNSQNVSIPARQDLKI